LAEPLRLGLSGSAFAYVMPREVLARTFAPTDGKSVKLDDRQNAMMVDFMRDMMSVMSSSRVEAMECYHSTAWDRDAIIDVVDVAPNIEIWSVHSPYGRWFDPSSPDPEARAGGIEAYCDAVEAARMLGAKVVVAHPGANVQYDTPKSERLKLAVEPFQKIADLAGESGIKVAIEPLPKQEPGSTLDEVLWLIDHIKRPNVGVNLDVNHLFPPEQVPSYIEKAGDLIINVHISDQDGQERHWLPFQGTLDWQRIIDSFVKIGYAGPLVYETHIRDAKTCEDVGRAVVENYSKLIALAPISST